MAKILDPDDLTQGTEIVFNTSAKTITLAIAGNLSTDGVALQCVYSFTKEEWKTDDALIKYPFPLEPVDGPSGTQFDLIGGWDWGDDTSRELLRDGGWAVKDSSGASLEEYMNLTSLGSFDDSANDQAYYIQAVGADPVSVVLPGEVNQAIKIYGDASHGSIDYRGVFKIFLREAGKAFDEYDLITEQAITALTYKKYALPLSNSTDLKVTHTDAEVAVAPYDLVDITYYASDQLRDIGGTDYNFRTIIDGNDKTLEQIYEKIQYQLRQIGDIDEGAATVRGDTADGLLYFIGDTLVTSTGVFIDNLNAADTNRIDIYDTSGTKRTYPYTAALTIQFNSTLSGDADAIYRAFISNDDAGDNTGRDYGTDLAMLLDNDTGVDIAGDILAASSVSANIDYDGNVQRGAASAGADIPITVVALGLESGQFVVATGSVTRSKSNVITLTAAQERTYNNPA